VTPGRGAALPDAKTRSLHGGVRPGAQNLPGMRVLGIDPGTANTGYGVVASAAGRLEALAAGLIETSPRAPLERRLADIHARVAELIDEHEPDAVAVEDLYFGTNARSAFAVGQARGVVLLAAGQRALPCAAYTPQQVKGAVCGSGRADKTQVARMVTALLRLHDQPAADHTSDALAVAVCHLNRAPLQSRLAEALGRS
jgi:crossover junction endodeoxyribonuclease RuvC